MGSRNEKASSGRSLGLSALCGSLLIACAGSPHELGDARDASSLAAKSERYVWVDARCNDGSIDLASIGFERTVDVEKRTDGYLLTYETKLATDGCRSTAIFGAHAEKELYTYRMQPKAWVSWPMHGSASSDAAAVEACGVEEREAALGELHFAGDALEIVLQRSPWCRGFDAHFVYRSVPRAPLSAEAVVARYVAHFSRGDASSLAALFDDQGAVIESFSASKDGQPTRHEGRVAIRAYFERVFASASWHAARLLSLSSGDAASEVIAELEYIDSELAEPLRVRSSFVLAGGEIFESDTQLVTDPKPIAMAGNKP